MSITNCGMFRFGGGQTFKKPTLKECGKASLQ